MLNDSINQPILVTGASGFLASWIIKKLLENGKTVHATVRNKRNTAKINHLLEIAKSVSGQLIIFEADLLKPNSFKEAMQTCAIVIHTASPFLNGKPKDPEASLIRPAVDGTKNVLYSANEIECVKRIVLTSSVVAMHTDATDILEAGGTLKENLWNRSATLTYQPYSLSKTKAEKAAWEIAEKQKRWQLTTINPGFILGPSLTSRKDSVSISFMSDMGNGKFKMGGADLQFTVVDVRDVAEAHVVAAIKSEASGRHVLVNTTMNILDMADELRDQFGKNYPLPKSNLPKWLVWLVGPIFGLSRKYISRHYGKKYSVDNSYSIKDLGINYRPVNETLVDQFNQLIKDGIIKKN